MNRDSGVSSVVGTVAMLAVAVMGITTMLVVGLPTLQSQQQDAMDAHVERLFERIVDEQLTPQVSGATRVFQLPVTLGELEVREGAARSVSWIELGSSNPDCTWVAEKTAPGNYTFTKSNCPTWNASAAGSGWLVQAYVAGAGTSIPLSWTESTGQLSFADQGASVVLSFQNPGNQVQGGALLMQSTQLHFHLDGRDRTLDGGQHALAGSQSVSVVDLRRIRSETGQVHGVSVDWDAPLGGISAGATARVSSQLEGHDEIIRDDLVWLNVREQSTLAPAACERQERLDWAPTSECSTGWSWTWVDALGFEATWSLVTYEGDLHA